VAAKQKRVVLIGTGGRANAYTMYGAKEQVALVGVADPLPQNRRLFFGLNSLVGLVPEFDDWRTMLDSTPDIDGVIITTPNHTHTEPAVECMKRGYVLALEKPIAESPENCRLLLEAKRRYNARVVVGFVLRASPFYLKAREWIDAGRIGKVVTIQADELPHPLTTSVMMRGDWRRFRKTSGGSMLEKCCHDLDMLNWMAGGSPQSLNSFGGIKTFAPRADVPARCADCHIQDTCLYYMPPKVYDHPDMVKKANDGLLYKFVRDNSACVYNNGHDIYDHQTVQLEYDNGVLATLVMDFSCAGTVCGRYLKIVGDKGVIFGKVEENKISLQTYSGNTVETYDVKDDGSGHGGANKEHADLFLRMMENPEFHASANLEAGYLSAMLCFAADQSVEEKRRLDVSHYISDAGLAAGFDVK
jgi:predicted dehydrogenase